MQQYLVRRLLLFLPTLFLASLVVFGVMRVLPGDVALVILAGGGESAQGTHLVERLREELGLNDPLAVQYGRWVWSLVNGQFGGRSLASGQPVGSLLLRQLPVTLQLTLYTAAASLLLAVPAGVLAALHHNRWPDYAVRAVTVAGHALPNFAVALLVLLGLVTLLRWAPPVVYRHPWENPWDHARTMALPTLVLAWGYASHLARVIRASTLEVLRQDYIRTARAKGLPEAAVALVHALPNTLVTVATLGGLQVAGLLSGAVIIESIFGVPGVGRGLVAAVAARDYPVVQTFAMLLVLTTLALNLLIDVGYALLDRRLVHGAG